VSLTFHSTHKQVIQGSDLSTQLTALVLTTKQEPNNTQKKQNK